MTDDERERLETIEANLEVAAEQLLQQLEHVSSPSERRTKIKGWALFWFAQLFDLGRQRVRDMATAVEIQSRLIERLKQLNEDLQRRVSHGRDRD